MKSILKKMRRLILITELEIRMENLFIPIPKQEQSIQAKLEFTQLFQAKHLVWEVMTYSFK